MGAVILLQRLRIFPDFYIVIESIIFTVQNEDHASLTPPAAKCKKLCLSSGLRDVSKNGGEGSHPSFSLPPICWWECSCSGWSSSSNLESWDNLENGNYTCKNNQPTTQKKVEFFWNYEVQSISEVTVSGLTECKRKTILLKNHCYMLLATTYNHNYMLQTQSYP